MQFLSPSLNPSFPLCQIKCSISVDNFMVAISDMCPTCWHYVYQVKLLLAATQLVIVCVYCVNNFGLHVYHIDEFIPHVYCVINFMPHVSIISIIEITNILKLFHFTGMYPTCLNSSYMWPAMLNLGYMNYFFFLSFFFW